MKERYYNKTFNNVLKSNTNTIHKDGKAYFHLYRDKWCYQTILGKDIYFEVVKLENGVFKSFEVVERLGRSLDDVLTETEILWRKRLGKALRKNKK